MTNEVASSTITQVKQEVADFSKQYASLLKNPKFFWLFCANLISTIGNFLSNIALLTIVNENSGSSSGIAIGAIFLCMYLQPIILLPFTGVVVDLVDRRKLMFFCDIARAVLVAMFLLVTMIDPKKMLWLVYVVLILMYSVNAFFDPCRESMIPVVVQDKNLLVSANALDSLTWMCCMFLGSALGGLITATLGPSVAFVLDSASFLLSAVCVFQMLRIPNFYARKEHEVPVNDLSGIDTTEQPLTEDADITNDEIVGSPQLTETEAEPELTEYLIAEDSPALEPVEDITPPERYSSYGTSAKAIFKTHIYEFFYGLRFFKNNPYLFSLLLVKSAGVLTYSGLFELVNTKLASTYFKVGKDASGMLGISKAVVGVGSGLAPVVVERIVSITIKFVKRRRGETDVKEEVWDPNVSRGVMVSSLVGLLIGFLLVYLGAYIHVSVYLIGAFVAGGAAGVMWTVSSAAIFQVCPEELLGRAMSLDIGLFCSISVIVSVLGGGLVYDLTHMKDALPLALIYIGVEAVLIGGWSIWWFVNRRVSHDTRSASKHLAD